MPLILVGRFYFDVSIVLSFRWSSNGVGYYLVGFLVVGVFSFE